MKKLFVLAGAAMLVLTMTAQHVTPLNITAVSVRLDTLRTSYGTDMVAYQVQLQRILDSDLKTNDEALKQARKQLNEEKAYSKCIADYVKDASKVLKTVEKNCNEEIKDLTDLQNTIDKQTVTANKLTLITHDSKPKFIAHMEVERKELGTERQNIQNKLEIIKKQQAQVKRIQDGLDIFNVEITNKENDLKLKESQYKDTEKAVKEEIKNVKAEIKAAKK